MEHSVACLDHEHFLKSNEIVRLFGSLISLFDTRVKFNINWFSHGGNCFYYKWNFGKFLITTRDANQRQDRQKDEFSPWEYW